MNLEKSITVCNVRGHERTADLCIYCGRGEAPHGLIDAKVGNPHTIQRLGRLSAIARYEGMVLAMPPDARHWKVIRRLAKRLNEGKTVQLFCWCKPAPCHCDFIRLQILKTAHLQLL